MVRERKLPGLNRHILRLVPVNFMITSLKWDFVGNLKTFYYLHSVLNIDSSQTQKILLPVPIKRSDFIAMIGWASERKYKVRSYHIGHESNICFATWPLSDFHVY